MKVKRIFVVVYLAVLTACGSGGGSGSGGGGQGGGNPGGGLGGPGGHGGQVPESDLLKGLNEISKDAKAPPAPVPPSSKAGSSKSGPPKGVEVGAVKGPRMPMADEEIVSPSESKKGPPEGTSVGEAKRGFAAGAGQTTVVDELEQIMTQVAFESVPNPNPSHVR